MKLQIKHFKGFINHLKKYDKVGNVYFQKGYSRSYTKDNVIEHFIKKL